MGFQAGERLASYKHKGFGLNFLMINVSYRKGITLLTSPKKVKLPGVL